VTGTSSRLDSFLWGSSRNYPLAKVSTPVDIAKLSYGASFGPGSDSFHLVLYESNDIRKDQKVTKNLRRVNKPPSSATVTISKIINI